MKETTNRRSGTASPENSNPSAPMGHKENLLGVLETIFKFKRFIFFTCLVVGVGAIITVLLVPVYYKSTTIFYAASQDVAMPEFIFGRTSQAMNYYGTDDDADRLMSIAKSGELANFLIDSFDLYNHYKIDASGHLAPYYVRKTLSGLFTIKRTKEDAIEISIEDEDKEIAANMVNATREKISEIAQRLIKGNQGKALKTYEENIAKNKKELADLNDSLEQIRQRFGIYNTLSQSENLAELIAKTEAKLTNNKAVLQVFNEAQGINPDTITFIKAKINGYEKELVNLNGKMDTFNRGMSKVDALTREHREIAAQLSGDGLRYNQLKSAFESIFPTTLLVEAGSVPIVKSRPQRMLIVAISVIIAFLFSVIGVLIFDTYKEVNWQQIFHAK